MTTPAWAQASPPATFAHQRSRYARNEFITEGQHVRIVEGNAAANGSPVPIGSAPVAATPSSRAGVTRRRPGIEISAHQIAPFLGVEFGSHAGRTHQIAEYHRKISTFAGGFDPADGCGRTGRVPT